MSVKTHISNSASPYHICVRTNNADWFELPMPEVWDLFSDYLHFVATVYNLRIHAFVLMSNHFHLIASTPEANLSQAMNYLIREASKEISRMQNRKNHNFKNRYFRSVIANHHQYMNVYKYVYRNPVEAGLSLRAESYPYSTLSGLVGQAKMHIPMIEDRLLFEDIEGTLQWINTAPEVSHRQAMQKALKRRVFKLAKCGANKMHILESQLY